MTYQTIEVKKIAGALGATIRGADLANLNQETFAEIHKAFLENLVVFFLDQDLTTNELKDFGRRFGPLLVDPIVQSKEGEPEVLAVVKEPHEKRAFGENWHTDSTFWEKPPLCSILYAHELPDFGGDTMFSNQYMAFETLSEGLKTVLRKLKGVHRPVNYEHGATNGIYTPDRSMKLKHDDPDFKKNVTTEMIHPCVRTHPETGRETLFVNSTYTQRFDGWTQEESMPLLKHIFAHAIRPEFTCRYTWSPGAVAMWDNRCTMHRPINDYNGKRRVMSRIVAEGDRPV